MYFEYKNLTWKNGKKFNFTRINVGKHNNLLKDLVRYEWFLFINSAHE